MERLGAKDARHEMEYIQKRAQILPPSDAQEQLTFKLLFDRLANLAAFANDLAQRSASIADQLVGVEPTNIARDKPDGVGPIQMSPLYQIDAHAGFMQSKLEEISKNLARMSTVF